MRRTCLDNRNVERDKARIVEGLEAGGGVQEKGWNESIMREESLNSKNPFL